MKNKTKATHFEKNARANKKYFSQKGLQDLKQDIDLVFAIGAEVKLINKGKRFFGKCPMHNDTKNSLVISPKKNLWYCFGSCQQGGSLVDWVMASKKLRLIEALALLAEHYPFLAQKGQVGDIELNQTLPEQYDLATHQPLLLQLIDHYKSCLANKPKVIQYLRGLGISPAVINKYKIGFSDNSMALALQDSAKNGNEILEAELLELGVLQNLEKGGLVERFNSQIVFPVLNDKSEIVQLFGRTLPKELSGSHLQLMVS